MPFSIVKKEITGTVQNYWDANQKVMLLSQLGAQLRNKNLWSKGSVRETLTEFIEKNLSDTLRVERHPNNPLILGILPKSALLSRPLREYFGPSKKSDRLPRYHPSFWAGFSKAINSGCRRFMNIDTRHFDDVPATSESPKNVSTHEIPADIIPDSDIEDRDAAIAKKIEAWAQQYDVDLSSFIVSSQRTSAAWVRGPERRQHQSLLDRMLEALSEKDMVRVQMPLDIVNKLRTRRG